MSDIDIVFEDILPAFAHDGKGPLVIAGPCSAESSEQLLRTAADLRTAGFRFLRAGAWKPRTMPGGFEGRGSVALKWLAEAQSRFNMPVATEVANAEHTLSALEAGVNILWIGARTTANPFAVQEIADTLAQLQPEGDSKLFERVAVLVKNPVNPDLALWIGALQRLYNAGVRLLGAVHRGFSSYGASVYRNPPFWAIPIELHRRIPNLQLLCDPSHIAGNRKFIAPLMQEALDLGFDGFLVEAHCDPDNALSDSAQQVTPQQLRDITDSLVQRRNKGISPTLTALREEIDALDDSLIQLLSQRMEVSRAIGLIKKASDMAVVQPDRYDKLMTQRLQQATGAGLSEPFMRHLFSLIHQESVAQQAALMHSDVRNTLN